MGSRSRIRAIERYMGDGHCVVKVDPPAPVQEAEVERLVGLTVACGVQPLYGGVGQDGAVEVCAAPDDDALSVTGGF
jgi:hypothetical protein